MRGIAPDATVIDITHGIPPQAVTQGAVVLARAIPYMPVCVHLAVVDPGVGSARRPIAVRTATGRIFVGPDNGLLMRAADREGIESARALTNARYHLEQRLTHVPRARHLRARRRASRRRRRLRRSRREIDPATLVRINLPEPEVGDGEARATVLTVDRFGNLALNVTREHLDALSLEPGRLGRAAVRARPLLRAVSPRPTPTRSAAS